MTIRFELTPKTSRQKSYYRKAFVIIENGVRALQSYETRVASFDPFEEVFTFNGWYSMTTGRHLEDFCAQCAEEIGAKWWKVRNAIQEAAKLHSGRAFFDEVETVDLRRGIFTTRDNRTGVF